MKTEKGYGGWRSRPAPVGLYVYDVNGDKIGRIDVLYYPGDADLPEWMAISSGLFGSKTCFAPMTSSIPDGKVCLPYTKAQVKEAPKLNPNGYLTADVECELSDHYGFSRHVRR